MLHRQGSRQIPTEVSRRLADGLPNGRLVELPGSTPTLFLEGGDADLDIVIPFFVSGDVGLPSPHREPGALTPREKEVLRLLAAGATNARIGHRLGISEHTVERHVANLYRKIGARGRAEATVWALRSGHA